MTCGRRRQTHCKRGHEFTDETTYSRQNKAQRECRLCIAIRYRFRYRHDEEFREAIKEKSRNYQASRRMQNV